MAQSRRSQRTSKKPQKKTNVKLAAGVFIGATVIGGLIAAIVGTVMFLWPQQSNEQNNALLDAIAAREYVKVQELLDAGADPNATDASGNNALHRIVKHNKPKLTLEIIEAGADINAISGDEEKSTALHYAIESGDSYIPIALLLLENGANPNARDRRDDTPLHYAAEYMVVGIVNPLVEAGADVNAVNAAGQTPLDVTNPREVYPVSELMARTLQSHGAKRAAELNGTAQASTKQ